ncbi:hypothetical protein V1291_002857 [Nitrobacteraceae bacterium AZCC 1564]
MARKAKAVALNAVSPATIRWLFAGLALAAAIAFAGGARAGATFDGAWKVTIITQSGNCDPAYSYPVKVVDGRISYSGDGSFDISGRVGEAGAVSVAIARGDQKASASGKLSGNSGFGHWSGKSASTVCSGRWEATRSL